jgi:hypothetical protein
VGTWRDERRRLIGPLAEACGPRTCGDYDDGVAELRGNAAAGMCFECSLGECGRYRVVTFHNGLFGDDRYYDREGKLVGVHAFSDANDQACHGVTNYGHVPSCERTVVEMVESPPPDAGPG